VEDIERIQSIGAEVIADFPEGYTIDETAVSIDDGEPEMLDFWAFIRAKQRSQFHFSGNGVYRDLGD
jgi:hypothetical protein